MSAQIANTFSPNLILTLLIHLGNRVLIIVAGLGLIACDRVQKQVSYYPNGQIEIEAFLKDSLVHGEMKDYFPNGSLSGISKFKEGKREGASISYYENGNIKSKVIYQNGFKVDTARYYYEDETLEQIVPFKKGYKNGWVLFYDKKGRLKEKPEYFSQGSKDYQNQWIGYDEQGRVLKDSSMYISLRSDSDSIKVGENYKLIIKLETPVFGDESKMEVQIGNFNDDYILNHNAILDTIPAKNFTSTINIQPRVKGKHILRGRVVNYIINDKKETQPSWLKKEVHIYFTKDYHVE